MDRPQFLDNIMSWLRAGYPNGVPGNDYLPLFALLRRQVSEAFSNSLQNCVKSSSKCVESSTTSAT